jgi:hypothetical protein
MSKKQKAKVANELKAKNNENNLEFIQSSSNQSHMINNLNSNALGSLSSSSTSSISFQNSSILSTSSSSSPPDNSSLNVMSSSPNTNCNSSNIVIQSTHSNINILHQANINQNNQNAIQNNISNLNNSNMIIANFNLANNNCQNISNMNTLNDYSQNSLSSNSSPQLINLSNYHPQVNQIANNLDHNFSQNRQISTGNYQQHLNQTYQNPQSLISENISNQFDQSNHFNNDMSDKVINSVSSSDINNLNYYKSDMNLIAKQIFDAHSRTFMCYIDCNQINQLKHNPPNNAEIQRIISLVILIISLFISFDFFLI